MNILALIKSRLGRKKCSASHAPPELRAEFQHLKFAGQAMQKLLDDFEFDTVLDIGSGAGEHVEIFRKHGKGVTAVDYGKSVYYGEKQGGIETIIADFNQFQFGRQFDCIWASHVLEHQLNVNLFLSKVYSTLKEGGVLAITVPPMKEMIVGGHLSIWNAGLLIYNLAIAGFDCSQISILRYDYNISAVLKKKSFTRPDLAFDKGDITRLSKFLPEGLSEPFDGNIWRLNW